MLNGDYPEYVSPDMDKDILFQNTSLYYKILCTQTQNRFRGRATQEESIHAIHYIHAYRKR